MGTKGTIFSTAKEERALQGVAGARHGRPWSQAELDDLECWLYQGKNLAEIVTLSQRSTGGVIPKLCSMRLINAVSNGTNSWVTDYAYRVDISDKPSEAQPEQPTIKEIIMTKTIENIVLIQGTNAVDKTDDEIFGLISKLELQKASLSNIKNQPKKLLAKIEAIDTDIAKLVEYVDGRE